MLSDYEKIDFLRANKYFETEIISDVIKYIKFQCMKYLVQDWKIELEGYTFDEYLQPWIDYGFKDSDFINFLEEQSFDEKSYIDYKNIYQQIASFLNQKIAKPKDTKPTYFFTSTSKIKFKHTAYNLIKQSIVDLTEINFEALNTQSLDEFELLLNQKKCMVPEVFEQFKLKQYLNIYDDSDQVMGSEDFEKYLELPAFINHEVLNKGKLLKSLFIEGISGSGKTTLAQRIAYEVSPVNSFYLDLSDEYTISIVNKNQKSIYEFINAVKHAEGTIVLDNIQSSDISKSLSKSFLIESYNIHFQVILVAQYSRNTDQKVIISFADKYFEKEKYSELKNSIHFLEFSDEEELIDIRYSMIKNLLTYYSKKGCFSKKISHEQIMEIERMFGALLIYLKYSFEDSLNINKLDINSSKLQIIKKYNSFIDLSNCKEFKFLITLIASNNGDVSFVKSTYKTFFIDESILIETLVKNKLIYFVEHTSEYRLSFPHKLIAKTLLHAIVTKERINKEKLFYDTTIYLLNMNGRILYSMILAYIKSDIYEIQYLIVILDTIFENLQSRRRIIQTPSFFHNLLEFSNRQELDIFAEYLEEKAESFSLIT